MPDIGKLVLIGILIICLNIPFGYWRAHVRKFSLQWMLAIHLPVPLVVFLRVFMHTGWHWITFVVFIAAFFSGQFLGGLLQKKLFLKYQGQTTSCLFVDLYRNIF